MRRTIKLVATGVFGIALLGSVVACDPASSQPEKAGHADVTYVKLPDKRVLECISNWMNDGSTTYTCNWNKPYSIDGTTPPGADIASKDEFKYVKVPGGITLQCISSDTNNAAYVRDCDWDHPVKAK